MAERRDFGLTRRTIPGNFDVDTILGAMKGPRSLAPAGVPNDSETEGTPIDADMRFRKRNKDYDNSNCFWKTTAQCKESGTDANKKFCNFDVADKSKWGEALPLFDGEDPVEGTEEDFDEIVYSKLSKLNEMQKLTKEKGEGKFRKNYRFFADWALIFTFMKLAFKIILIGIFVAFLYVIYGVNNNIY